MNGDVPSSWFCSVYRWSSVFEQERSIGISNGRNQSLDKVNVLFGICVSFVHRILARFRFFDETKSLDDHEHQQLKEIFDQLTKNIVKHERSLDTSQLNDRSSDSFFLSENKTYNYSKDLPDDSCLSIDSQRKSADQYCSRRSLEHHWLKFVRSVNVRNITNPLTDCLPHWTCEYLSALNTNALSFSLLCLRDQCCWSIDPSTYRCNSSAAPFFIALIRS